MYNQNYVSIRIIAQKQKQFNRFKGNRYIKMEGGRFAATRQSYLSRKPAACCEDALVA